MSEEQTVTDATRASTSRRALLVGVGAVGAATVLTACGADDGGDGGASDPGGADPTDAAEDPGTDSTDEPGGGGEVIGKTGDVPVGGGAIFAATQMVVTQPSAGTFKGFRAVCTHQGCPIASVDGGTINCSCHGSKFSLEDGSPRNGPATRPLTARDVAVQGDDIVMA